MKHLTRAARFNYKHNRNVPKRNPQPLSLGDSEPTSEPATPNPQRPTTNEMVPKLPDVSP